MKKLISYLLALLGITIILLGIFTLINKFVFLPAIYNPANFKLKETTYVMGDSHTQCAIDPEILPDTINLSKNSENYFLTLIKLRYFLQHNKPKRIILNFAYHNFSTLYDDEMLKSRRNVMLDRYYPIIENEENIFTSKHDIDFLYSKMKYDWGLPIDFSNNLHLYLYLLKHKEPDIANYPFGGYYRYNGTCNLSQETIKHSLEAHYSKDGKKAGVSELMYASVIQICKLCYENDIEVILVNTPVHPGYYKQIPSIFFENHKYVYDYLQRNFGIVYYDFSQLPIPDEGFGDGDHLNAVGATIFTNELAKVIKPLEE
ncbi:MAG: hypothetical protein JXR56_00055 [Candidatus Cloacimonetes bacterium]|nr:hypothetical protein [Candidatus Cloacimonadota bacterium]